LVVGCVFEDRAFQYIACPLVERVFDEEGLLGEQLTSFTHGCRFEPLSRILLSATTNPDLWIIGADCGRRSPAQKERAMRRNLTFPDNCLFALPQPGIEAWMQADLRAFKEGLQRALDADVTLPAHAGPYPPTENLAKQRLANLVRACGVDPLQGGVEYGPQVMAFMPFDAHPSLRDFVAQLRHKLRLLLGRY
jgi:hypothetical protein